MTMKQPKTNRELIANFIQGDNPKNNKRLNVSISGHLGECLLSYSTCIAAKHTNKEGKRFLFVSNSYFSHTTSRHIHYTLVEAANKFEIIRVPFEYCDNFYFLDGEILDLLGKRFIKHLKLLSEYNLNIKEHRDAFCSLFYYADKFNTEIKKIPYLHKWFDKTLNRCKEIEEKRNKNK